MKSGKLSTFSFGLIFTSLIIQSIASAAITDHMTPDQIDRVKKGEQVYTTEKIPGAKWSKVIIFQTINCTPEEAAAVTMDWGYKKNYTSDTILKSQVTLSKFNGADAMVDYSVKVPLIGSENFTLENKMYTNDNGKSYETTFAMTHSDHTRGSNGITTFENFEGVTLMQVVSHTDPPNIPLIGMAEKSAVEQTLATCTQFVNQVVTEKASNPTLLQKQVNELQQAMTQLQATTSAP